MNRPARLSQLIRRLTIVVVAIVIAGISAAVPAGAAGTPGWRIVDTIGPANGSSGLFQVSASSAGNAWATGALCGTACEKAGGNNPRPIVERWNGKAWSQVAMPKGTSVFVQSAAIPGGVWASAYKGKCRTIDAFRWTGKKWVNTGAPGCKSYFWFAAFSASDAWTFGNGRCAARYNGRRWHVIKLPFDAQFGSGAIRASKNFWLLGTTVGRHPHNVLMHWTGRWHSTVLPAVPHPAGLVEGAGPIVATGLHDV